MIKHHKTKAYSLFMPFNDSQNSTPHGINSNNLPDTISKLNGQSSYLTYTSYGNPLTITSGSSTERFYYETYQVPTTVPPAELSTALSVYPNPASDRLFIKASGLQADVSFQWSIINSLGQAISAGKGKFDGDITVIPVGLLAAGTYTIIVRQGMHSLNAGFVRH